MEFHWIRFGISLTAAIGLAGIAVAASGPVSVAFWIMSGLAALGALADFGLWLSRRPKKPDQTPQAIHAPAIESQTKVFSPTIVQADRPGWRAMCEDAGSVGQPHGAVLYIASDQETARDFRCLVRKEGQEPASVQRPGGNVGRHSAHYPKAFPGALPISEGEYTFEWFGYVDELPNEMLLASGTFRVNNHLQVFCDDEEISAAGEPFVEEQPRQRRTRLTSTPVATPAAHKSAFYDASGTTTHESRFPARWRFFIGQGAAGVDLVCRKWQDDVPVSVACVVEDSKGVRRPGRLQRVGDMVRCTYPEDFDTEAAAGLHFVHWLIARRHLFGEEVGDPNGTAPMVDPIDFSIEVTEDD